MWLLLSIMLFITLSAEISTSVSKLLRPVRVGIIGSGPAGLLAALALQKGLSHSPISSISVIEALSDPRPVQTMGPRSYSVGLNKRGRSAIQSIDSVLWTHLETQGVYSSSFILHFPPPFSFLSLPLRDARAVDLYKPSENMPASLLIARNRLCSVIMERILYYNSVKTAEQECYTPVELLFNSKIHNIDLNTMQIHFTDTSTATVKTREVDLLLGCDGLNSQVRTSVLTHQTQFYNKVYNSNNINNNKFSSNNSYNNSNGINTNNNKNISDVCKVPFKTQKKSLNTFYKVVSLPLNYYHLKKNHKLIISNNSINNDVYQVAPAVHLFLPDQRLPFTDQISLLTIPTPKQSVGSSNSDTYNHININDTIRNKTNYIQKYNINEGSDVYSTLLLFESRDVTDTQLLKALTQRLPFINNNNTNTENLIDNNITNSNNSSSIKELLVYLQQLQQQASSEIAVIRSYPYHYFPQKPHNDTNNNNDHDHNQNANYSMYNNNNTDSNNRINLTSSNSCSSGSGNKGVVLLLGDAAHCTGGTLGQGANSALQDVSFLIAAFHSVFDSHYDNDNNSCNNNSNNKHQYYNKVYNHDSIDDDNNTTTTTSNYMQHRHTSYREAVRCSSSANNIHDNSCSEDDAAQQSLVLLLQQVAARFSETAAQEGEALWYLLQLPPTTNADETNNNYSKISSNSYSSSNNNNRHFWFSKVEHQMWRNLFLLEQSWLGAKLRLFPVKLQNTWNDDRNKHKLTDIDDSFNNQNYNGNNDCDNSNKNNSNNDNIEAPLQLWISQSSMPFSQIAQKHKNWIKRFQLPVNIVDDNEDVF